MDYVFERPEWINNLLCGDFYMEEELEDGGLKTIDRPKCYDYFTNSYATLEIITYYDENGDFHNENGPAIITNNGEVDTTLCYYKHGKLHNLNGSAVYWGKNTSGLDVVEYWIDGKQFSEEEYEKAVLNYENI